jgi:hypothetical protein
MPQPHRGRLLGTWLLVALSLGLGASLIFAAAQPAAALPEYAVLTGEPCASCHASPSGGGLRTPRGQAWVAAARPGLVPNLASALALLGVRLPVDLAAYTTVPASVPPAAPPSAESAHPSQAAALESWLCEFGGN